MAELRLEVCSCEGSCATPRKLQLQARMAVEIQIYQSSAVPITQGLDAPPEDGMELLQEETQLELLTAVAEKSWWPPASSPWERRGSADRPGPVAHRGGARPHQQGDVWGTPLCTPSFPGERHPDPGLAHPLFPGAGLPGAEPGDRAEVSCQTLLLQSEIAEGSAGCSPAR